MENKVRNVLLIFGLFILLLIPVSFLSAEETKKYPPYPDVWGYKFPWPEKDSRRSGIDIAKMPSGDYKITYVKKWINIKRKDGSCCDSVGRFVGISFFSGGSKELTEKEYNEFWNKNRSKRIRDNKAILSNGNVIEQVSTATSAHCPDPFYDYYIIKKDKDGKTIEKKMLLYLYESPQRTNINRYCERNSSYQKDHILKWVENVYGKFVPLEDDTFLIYDTSGNIIIRFDDNFNTKSSLINSRLFVIDRTVYEKIYNSLAKEGKINDQDVNDAIANYLKDLKKGVEK